MLDELKEKAQELLNNEEIREKVEKAKDWVNSDKGKEMIENAKDKVEDFVRDKTDGKGILGFGKEE